jgi:hypothetical protein
MRWRVPYFQEAARRSNTWNNTPYDGSNGVLTSDGPGVPAQRRRKTGAPSRIELRASRNGLTILPTKLYRNPSDRPTDTHPPAVTRVEA